MRERALPTKNERWWLFRIKWRAKNKRNVRISKINWSIFPLMLCLRSMSQLRRQRTIRCRTNETKKNYCVVHRPTVHSTSAMKCCAREKAAVEQRNERAKQKINKNRFTEFTCWMRASYTQLCRIYSHRQKKRLFRPSAVGLYQWLTESRWKWTTLEAYLHMELHHSTRHSQFDQLVAS